MKLSQLKRAVDAATDCSDHDPVVEIHFESEVLDIVFMRWLPDNAGGLLPHVEIKGRRKLELEEER